VPEELQQSGLTEERLARLSGPEFESLVNHYLRAQFPELASPGSSLKDAPVGFPVDALGYIPGDVPTWIFAASTTTTEDHKIAEKWFGHGKNRNDIRKAAEYFAQVKEAEPNARCRLYVALSHRPGKRRDLWPKVVEEGKACGIEVHPLEASAIASYLDTVPRGQYLRQLYLKVPGELLSAPLLQDLCAESISFLRATAALATADYEVRREATDAVLAILDEPDGSVIHLRGAPGMGKTVVLAQVGEAVLDRGGVPLWIRASSLRPDVSLEALLLEVLRAISPGLHHSAGRSTIELAKTSPGGLTLLIDDINRHEDPAQCLAVIDRLAGHHQAGAATTQASPIGVHCVVPVWLDVLKNERGEEAQTAAHKQLIPVKTYSSGEERQLASVVRERGDRISQDIVDRLGGDPFLCGLALATDRMGLVGDTRTLLRCVASDFLNRAGGDAARDSSVAATSSQILDALDALVDLLLECGTPEPSWSTVWADLGERQGALLLSVTNSRTLASLTGAEQTERWHWKHRRLRDIVIARRLARRARKAASEGRTQEEIQQWAANPGLSDALALSLVFLPTSFASDDLLAILDNLSAPSLAEVLRLGIFTDEGEERSRVIARLRSLLEDMRPDGILDYVESEYWRTLSKLSTIRDPAVPEVVEGARGWAQLAARMRNGDLMAAITWTAAIAQRDDFVLIWMPDFQAALDDLLATTENSEEILRAELAQAHGVEDIKVRLLLIAASGTPGLAKDVWQTWESLSATERLNLLPTVVWALSRCADDRSAVFLEHVLRQWAEDLRNPPTMPYEVHNVWLTLNHWPFSDAAIVAWVDVGLKAGLPTRYLRHVIQRLDHPYAVESYLRWCAANPKASNLGFGEPMDRLAPLVNTLDHFPASDKSRARLWEMVQTVHDRDLRRLAFEVWRRHVTTRDVGCLQALDEDDELFTRALETRLRLQDASAAPALLARLSQDPGTWMGFAPAMYWQTGVHEAIVENLEAALECWQWTVQDMFLHLPAEGVRRIVQERDEVLLKSARTWPTLWRSGEPAALALVRCALHLATPQAVADELNLDSDVDNDEFELRFFFSSFMSGLPNRINRTMLETIEPFLDRFPSTQLGHLAEAAVTAGFDTWARGHLKNRVPDYIARTLWLQETAAREILDRAANAAANNPLAVLNTPDFFRLRSRDGLDFDLLWLLEQWLQENRTTERFAVCALLVDAAGTGNDAERWDRLRPVDTSLLRIWGNVRYTLCFRGWEGV